VAVHENKQTHTPALSSFGDTLGEYFVLQLLLPKTAKGDGRGNAGKGIAADKFACSADKCDNCDRNSAAVIDCFVAVGAGGVNFFVGVVFFVGVEASEAVVWVKRCETFCLMKVVCTKTMPLEH
jgi:hypothetical protein